MESPTGGLYLSPHELASPLFRGSYATLCSMIDPKTVTHTIALLTILGQGGLLLVLLGWPWRKSTLRQVYDFLSSQALLGAFVVAAFSMLGSLYFSEVAKYVPCELCWYQRILMYPQVVLLGLALAKKNRDIATQVLALCGLGAVIAVYHIYLQSGGTALVPCTTTALAVPCGVKNFQEFGFVTIPVMSLTGFVMLMAAMIFHRQQQKKNAPSEAR